MIATSLTSLLLKQAELTETLDKIDRKNACGPSPLTLPECYKETVNCAGVLDIIPNPKPFLPTKYFEIVVMSGALGTYSWIWQNKIVDLCGSNSADNFCPILATIGTNALISIPIARDGISGIIDSKKNYVQQVCSLQTYDQLADEKWYNCYDNRDTSYIGTKICNSGNSNYDNQAYNLEATGRYVGIITNFFWAIQPVIVHSKCFISPTPSESSDSASPPSALTLFENCAEGLNNIYQVSLTVISSIPLLTNLIGEIKLLHITKVVVIVGIREH